MPARNRGVGSGGHQHQTSRFNNKYTVVEPQMPSSKANQEKSGPGESSSQKSRHLSEAAVHLENSRWREAGVCQESSHLSGAAVNQESGSTCRSQRWPVGKAGGGSR